MAVRLNALKAEMLVQHETELAAMQRQLNSELLQARAAAEAEVDRCKEQDRQRLESFQARCVHASMQTDGCSAADGQVCTCAVAFAVLMQHESCSKWHTGSSSF